MVNKKALFVIIGGAFALAITIGAIVLTTTQNVSAQEASIDNVVTLPLNLVSKADGGEGGFDHRGGGRFPGGDFFRRGAGDGTYLAQALGITVEELEAAQKAAHEAAIDQALADGLITEAQAEMLKQGDFGFRGRDFLFGMENDIDREALLAEQLGITVEELQAARVKAMELALQAKIESGELTQEQADLLKARQALQNYIDKDALFSDATGMTMEEMKDKLQSAYEAALQEAVNDGVITQEQADLILERQADSGRGFFPGFGGKPGDRGGFEGFPFPPGSETIAPDSDA